MNPGPNTRLFQSLQSNGSTVHQIGHDRFFVISISLFSNYKFSDYKFSAIDSVVKLAINKFLFLNGNRDTARHLEHNTLYLFHAQWFAQWHEDGKRKRRRPLPVAANVDIQLNTDAASYPRRTASSKLATFYAMYVRIIFTNFALIVQKWSIIIPFWNFRNIKYIQCG